MRLGVQDGLSKILSLNNLSRLEVAKKKKMARTTVLAGREEKSPLLSVLVLVGKDVLSDFV